jgi:hypothetical protein
MIQRVNSPSPRTLLIRKHFTPSQLGAEIGPFHSPLCPKSEGFNCLVVDAFSREQLLKDYAHDTYVMDRAGSIEDVDIVSTQPLGEALAAYAQQPAAKIASNTACISYIVSSHNFEHQPNPIRFLQDAETAIRPGGYLVMAIPIASRCFDCFQPLSRTGEFIDAYYLQKTKPSVGNVFDHQASSSKLLNAEGINDQTYDFDKVVVNAFNGVINEETYNASKQSAEASYIDSHCWRLNPFQFELIFSDLLACGFINHLSIAESIVHGSEFVVYLQRTEAANSDVAFTAERRTELLKKSIEFQFSDLLQKHLAKRDNSPTRAEGNRLADTPPSGSGLKAKLKRVMRKIVAQ